MQVIELGHLQVLPEQPSVAPEMPLKLASISPVGGIEPSGDTGEVSVTAMSHLEDSAVVIVDGTHERLVLVARLVTETIAGVAVLSLPACALSPM